MTKCYISKTMHYNNLMIAHLQIYIYWGRQYA